MKGIEQYLEETRVADAKQNNTKKEENKSK